MNSIGIISNNLQNLLISPHLHAREGFGAVQIGLDFIALKDCTSALVACDRDFLVAGSVSQLGLTTEWSLVSLDLMLILLREMGATRATQTEA